MFKDLRTDTLDNGLRVYLLPVKGSPVVTMMVAYKVGSGDEEKDQTGLSHYLEHLMFKGTDKLVPGDIDRATQRNGGREQRLHDRGHDGLPLRLRRRPLADRAGHRGRPDAERPHRREARVRAGEGGGHRRAGRQRGHARGPRVQGDPAAAVPEGLAVLAPGHRRARARPRRDRRDHQAALRQVVPPEQRRRSSSSAGSTRTRRWRRSRSCSARSRRASCRRARRRPRSRTATARSARSSSRSSTCRGC